LARGAGDTGWTMPEDAARFAEMQAPHPLLLLSLVVLPATGRAQAPGYDLTTLACSRFAESVFGRVESRFGTVRRTETLGREGVLSVVASPDSDGVTIEAWFDTLSVFREGPEGRDTPDTDGMLGGRYGGVLDPQGSYLAVTAPFIPAAMRDIFDFARLPLHFFPPLPPRPIAPGGEWSDGGELTIWRLADSAEAAGAVQRYRWIRRERWDEGIVVADSTIVVHRSEREEGLLLWRGGEGPLGWESDIAATLEFSGGEGRSEVTQEVRVRRLSRDCR